MEQRKGFQWYRTLTKKQQKQFRLNCHKDYFVEYGVSNFNESLNEVTSFRYFISAAFTWHQTPQGYYYWKRISESRD